MLKIKLEILLANHLEHFKMAKDLSMIYPVNNPKRLLFEKVLNDLVIEMHEVQKLIDNER